MLTQMAKRLTPGDALKMGTYSATGLCNDSGERCDQGRDGLEIGIRTL